MAKLPGYRRILKQDLSDSPAWVTFLIQPLNLFMERVTKALENKLTFDENLDVKRFSLTIPSATGAEVDIGSRKVNGIIITRVSPEASISPVWEVVGNTLRVGPWPSVPSSDYLIEFIVF